MKKTDKLRDILGETYGGPSLSFENGQYIIYIWHDAPIEMAILARGDTIEECIKDFESREK